MKLLLMHAFARASFMLRVGDVHSLRLMGSCFCNQQCTHQLLSCFLATECKMSVVPLALWAYFSCSALILCGCQESAPFAVPAAAVPTEHAEGGAEDAFLTEMGSGVTVSLQVYAEAVSS